MAKGRTFKTLYDVVLALYDNPSVAEIAAAKAELNRGYDVACRSRPWTFLQTQATLAVAASATATALPDAFEALLPDAVITTVGYGGELVKRDLNWIMARRAETMAFTGTPTDYAIAQSAFSSTTGTTWSLYLYPIPSADLTLNVPYRWHPSPMTTDAEYPVGGPDFADCILYAGLAEWEHDHGKIDGEYAKLFREFYLPQAIARDLDREPRNLGKAGPGPAVERVAVPWEAASPVTWS